MELIITFKPSESTESNFTYTTSECRLKLCQKDANPINTDMVEFCEVVMNYLDELKYSISLRGQVKKLGSEFKMQLSQSVHHGNKNKVAQLNMYGDKSKLKVEVIDAEKFQKYTHQSTI